MQKTKLLRPLAAALAAAAVPLASAVDLNGVQVHGSLSATAAYSDNYDFYGNTQDDIDVNAVELILNGTYRFENGVRVGAQVFAYEYTNESGIVLDWANVDYQFKPWLGLRVGRVKRPYGLYGDAQDLDQVRTFASLPFAFYPRYLRTITASTDGLNVYGNVPAGRAGSLDYSVYFGTQDTIDEDTLLIQGYKFGIAPGVVMDFREWDVATVGGFQLAWNTPVDGLRLVASAFRVFDSEVSGTITPTPFSIRQEDMEVTFSALSAEYTRDKWLFAVEAQHVSLDATFRTNAPLAPPFFLGALDGAPFAFDIFAAYGMVTYQATDRLGLGAYYAYIDNDDGQAGAEVRETAHDYALAASYALQPWWLLKLEYHYIRGTAMVNNGGGDNPVNANSPSDMNYVLLKTTISF